MSDMIGVINDVLLYISNMDGKDIPQSEVPLILDILGNITQNAVLSNLNFSIGVSSNVITIANHLLAKRIWEPAARVNSKLGPQLLQSMEDLLCSLAPMQKPFNVSSSNVQMYCSVRPCSEASNGNSMAVTPEVNVSLPGHSFAPNCKATFLSVSFHTLGTNFPSDYEGDNGPRRVHNINSKIMTNVMKLGTEINHNANINITFTCSDKWCNETAICVFWNATLGRWSSDGCVTQVNNRVSKCICAHLTSYAVLMSMSEPQIDAVNDAILSRITNVGLVVSMGCLVLCIALQAILVGNAGNLMASYRHVAILNISLCLLFSNACFLVSSNIQVHAFELNCFALTFCIHFSLLAFFCWTLVQTLFLVCRLVFVFHHVTKREFTALAIILGYACPITISVATLLYFYPMHRYRKRDVCWLDSTSGASYAFTIPTIIILVGNFLGLVIVLRTLLRPSVSDAAREDEEVVKKLVKAVVFCTPQFGLTWAIGIPLLTNGNSLVLNYLFVLLNPLQGCFILVFACLMDKKVMDLLKRRFAKDPPEKSSDTTLSSA
ncbi:adhesion G-protein coupled receptor F3-like [Ambystoma mexicanum]|uniref:adhesion G-protein coupled receptor F3-like n=1 Tax=Ambystoma mexicanum TaxID=8296 RepID=UPI0037E89868